jgi:ribonuclease-3 family protein
MNYFSPQLSEQDANKISMLGLAHIGDGVYELLVRTMLCIQAHAAVGELHRLTVARVKAPAQAKAMERLLPLLDEGELALYKRGRNAHVHGVPQGASVGEYHAATGLAALFGWLYLQGRHERLNTLFAAAMED